MRVASDCLCAGVAMGKRSGKAGAGEDFASSLSGPESGCEEPREHFLRHLRQFMESHGFVPHSAAHHTRTSPFLLHSHCV